MLKKCLTEQNSVMTVSGVFVQASNQFVLKMLRRRCCAVDPVQAPVQKDYIGNAVDRNTLYKDMIYRSTPQEQLYRKWCTERTVQTKLYVA